MPRYVEAEAHLIEILGLERLRRAKHRIHRRSEKAHLLVEMLEIERLGRQPGDEQLFGGRERVGGE